MKSPASGFGVGDVLYGRLRPYLNKVWLADASGACSGELLVLRPCDELDGRYLALCLHSTRFVQYASGAVSGDRPRIDFATMAHFPLPMPDRETQEAIVDHVKMLFGEIEDGEAALAEARAGVETYRKTLLKAAVTGELTADWREHNVPAESADEFLQRIVASRISSRKVPAVSPRAASESTDLEMEDLGDLPEGWTRTSLGELFSVAVGATPARDKPALWSGDVPWVSSGEVAFCRIGQTREKISPTAVKPQRVVPPGTVLLGMIGEGKTRGQAAILDISAAHNQNCASIRVTDTEIPPEFVYWWLEYQYVRTRSQGSGGNQPALNKAKVEAIAIPLPPLMEIREIVTRLGKSLAELADLERAAAVAELGPSTLRQSILCAAFKGELG